MKKAVYTTAAALLACVTLFAACGESGSSAPSAPAATGPSETAADVTETTTTQDGLPSDLDFGGQKIRFAYRSYDPSDITAEQTGELVDDAIFERNSKVQERFNVNFEYQEFNAGVAAELPPQISSAVLAGSDDYDVIAWCQYSTLSQLPKGIYRDLTGAKYLDLSNPWWNQEYMEYLQIGNNHTYFLMGDICLCALKNLSTCFFDKQIYENFFGSPDDFYRDVLDGKWTVDVMRADCEAVYSDLNGNSKVDKDDLLGCMTSTIANTEHFAFGCDIRFSERDDKGHPYIVLDSERTVQLVDKLKQLYYETNGLLRVTDDKNWTEDSHCPKFKEDTLLFMPIWMQHGDRLRDMESDFGVLPYPKLDESQSRYRALYHDTSTIISMPQTLSDEKLDMISAVIEAMCCENMNTVIPYYYEVSLKTKYVRDDISAQVIDLIHDNGTTDFIYAYNYAVNSLGTIMRTLLGSQKKDFASTYAKLAPKAETLLAALIALYED